MVVVPKTPTPSGVIDEGSPFRRSSRSLPSGVSGSEHFYHITSSAGVPSSPSTVVSERTSTTGRKGPHDRLAGSDHALNTSAGSVDTSTRRTRTTSRDHLRDTSRSGKPITRSRILGTGATSGKGGCCRRRDDDQTQQGQNATTLQHNINGILAYTQTPAASVSGLMGSANIITSPPEILTAVDTSCGDIKAACPPASVNMLNTSVISSDENNRVGVSDLSLISNGSIASLAPDRCRLHNALERLTSQVAMLEVEVNGGKSGNASRFLLDDEEEIRGDGPPGAVTEVTIRRRRARSSFALSRKDRSERKSRRARSHQEQSILSNGTSRREPRRRLGKEEFLEALDKTRTGGARDEQQGRSRIGSSEVEGRSRSSTEEDGVWGDQSKLHARKQKSGRVTQESSKLSTAIPSSSVAASPDEDQHSHGFDAPGPEEQVVYYASDALRLEDRSPDFGSVSERTVRRKKDGGKGKGLATTSPSRSTSTSPPPTRTSASKNNRKRKMKHYVFDARNLIQEDYHDSFLLDASGELEDLSKSSGSAILIKSSLNTSISSTSSSATRNGNVEDKNKKINGKDNDNASTSVIFTGALEEKIENNSPPRKQSESGVQAEQVEQQHAAAAIVLADEAPVLSSPSKIIEDKTSVDKKASSSHNDLSVALTSPPKEGVKAETVESRKQVSVVSEVHRLEQAQLVANEERDRDVILKKNDAKTEKSSTRKRKTSSDSLEDDLFADLCHAPSEGVCSTRVPSSAVSSSTSLPSATSSTLASCTSVGLENISHESATMTRQSRNSTRSIAQEPTRACPLTPSPLKTQMQPPSVTDDLFSTLETSKEAKKEDLAFLAAGPTISPGVLADILFDEGMPARSESTRAEDTPGWMGRNSSLLITDEPKENGTTSNPATDMVPPVTLTQLVFASDHVQILDRSGAKHSDMADTSQTRSQIGFSPVGDTGRSSSTSSFLDAIEPAARDTIRPARLGLPEIDLRGLETSFSEQEGGKQETQGAELEALAVAAQSRSSTREMSRAKSSEDQSAIKEKTEDPSQLLKDKSLRPSTSVLVSAIPVEDTTQKNITITPTLLKTNKSVRNETYTITPPPPPAFYKAANDVAVVDDYQPKKTSPSKSHQDAEVLRSYGLSPSEAGGEAELEASLHDQEGETKIGSRSSARYLLGSSGRQ
ncbi:unnamed protein product [Amoebophrya sp. A25]|nr:unnamed protein product [Amoebophrya sp. A25]|eukprot:GSA25T00003941001.1